jgi:hypothetical protein
LSEVDRYRPDAIRHLKGFAIAVLGTAVLVTLVAVAWLAFIEGEAGGPSLAFLGTTSLQFFALASVVIGAFALFIGVPVTWVLAANRLENAFIYPVSGLLAGIGIAVAFATFVLPGPGALDILPTTALICGTPGAICGWLWWKFGRENAAR